MTKIEEPLVTTREKNLNLMLRFLGFGLILGWISVLSIVIAKEPVPPTDVIQQQHKMYKACKLPDVNGSMTVFVMEDNKMKCWRWK